jgi:signal peptidase I
MPKFLTNLGGFFLDIIETIVIALSIFLIIYLGALQPHQVSGRSMVPNFANGEFLLTDKVSYRLRDPIRGEVIVFHAPPAANCHQGTGCDFIKRVIGLPGETIEVRNDTIFINGEALPEPYIPDDFVTEPGKYTENRTFTLNADEYFVVGDNRPFSSDGRAWGPLPKNLIVGRALFSYWPVESIRTIRHAEYPVPFN